MSISDQGAPEFASIRPSRWGYIWHECPTPLSVPRQKPRPLTVVQRENSAATQRTSLAKTAPAVRRHRRTSQTTLFAGLPPTLAHSSSSEVFQFFCTLGCRLQKTIPAVQKRGCAAFGVGIKAAVRFPEFDPGALRLEQRIFSFC